MDKSINIEGIEFTPSMLKELSIWYSNGKDDSMPEQYVENLGKIQDFMSRILVANCGHVEGITELLMDIITMKDSLRNFIPMKGGQR